MQRYSKYSFLLFVGLLITSVNAQISVGIQGGLNSSIFNIPSSPPSSKMSYKNGLILGPIINYKITDNLSLQFEPRYVLKGYNVKVENIWNNYKSFNYLELPFFINIEFNELFGTDFQPLLAFGINAGYLLSAINELENHKTYDMTNDFKKIDITLDSGIGGKYYIESNIDFIINLRYSYGIYNIYKSESSINTRGIQLLVGLLFKI